MKVFIGCGSSDKYDETYLKETEMVCELFCNKDYDLVYGAYNKGLMGVLYNTFKKYNKHIYGTSINFYKNVDTIDKLDVFNRTTERFNNLYDSCDLIVILPGGIGSLAEMFNSFEELMIDNSNKKMIIYNMNNYYDDIIKFLNKNKEYINESYFNKVKIVNNIEELEKEI